MISLKTFNRPLYDSFSRRTPSPSATSLPIPSPSPPSSLVLPCRAASLSPIEKPLFTTELDAFLTPVKLDDALKDTLKGDLGRSRSEKMRAGGAASEASAWAALVTVTSCRRGLHITTELPVPSLVPSSTLIPFHSRSFVPSLLPPLLPWLNLSPMPLEPFEIPRFESSLEKVVGRAVYSRQWLKKRKKQWRDRRSLTLARLKKPISKSLLGSIDDGDYADERMPRECNADASFESFRVTHEALSTVAFKEAASPGLGTGRVNVQPIVTAGEAMAAKQRRIQSADGFLQECLRRDASSETKRSIENTAATGYTTGNAENLIVANTYFASTATSSGFTIGKRLGALMDEEAIACDNWGEPKPILSILPPLPYIESEKPGSIVFHSSTSNLLKSLLPRTIDLSNADTGRFDAVSTAAAIEADKAAMADARIADLVRSPGFFAPDGTKDAVISARAMAVANLYPWQTEIPEEEFHEYSMTAARSFVKHANSVSFKANNVRDVLTGCVPTKGFGCIEYKGLLSGKYVDCRIYSKRYESVFLALNKKLVGGIGSNLGVQKGVKLSLTEKLFVDGYIQKSIFRKPRDFSDSLVYSGNDENILDTIASRASKKKNAQNRRKKYKVELSAAMREAAALSEQVIDGRMRFAKAAKAASKAAKKKRKRESADARAMLKKLKQAKEQLMKAGSGGTGGENTIGDGMDDEYMPQFEAPPVNEQPPAKDKHAQEYSVLAKFASSRGKLVTRGVDVEHHVLGDANKVTNAYAGNTVYGMKKPPAPPSLLQDNFFGLHSKSKKAKEISRKKAAEIEKAADAELAELWDNPTVADGNMDWSSEKDSLKDSEETLTASKQRQAHTATHACTVTAAQLPQPTCCTTVRPPVIRQERRGLCSTTFLQYMPVITRLKQEYNITLYDNELLDEHACGVAACPILELSADVCLVLLDPVRTPIKVGTTTVIALRTKRRYARVFVLVLCEEDQLAEHTDALTQLHNSVGDSRNGDFVNISYCNPSSMAPMIHEVMVAAGCGENMFLAAFSAPDWTNHEGIIEGLEFLMNLTSSLGPLGAMELFHDWKGGSGEMSLELVHKGLVKDFEGQGRVEEEGGDPCGEGGFDRGGKRLVGLALAKSSLKRMDWNSHRNGR